MHPIVIVGAGIAGYGLARELRRRDAQIDITLIAADRADFYAKPMLSNALARGQTPETLIASTRADMARQLGITIVPHTCVERIDPDSRTLLSSSGLYHYRSLVLAIGAEPVRLHFWGDASDEVLSINHLDDYRRFRERLPASGHVALLGAGLIGCEFANDLTACGYRVTVIDPAPRPLAGLLPVPASTQLAEALAATGVQWRCGHRVRAIDRRAGRYRLSTEDGDTLDADLVLSAVGLRPQTALAAGAGLICERGIVVDRQLRTSAADIHALGDCAQIDGMVRPYVMPAVQAARALASTLTGKPTEMSLPPMPVTIKTPACPIVTCPPPQTLTGVWRELTEDGIRILRFESNDAVLAGFVVIGGHSLARQQALLREMAEPGR